MDIWLNDILEMKKTHPCGGKRWLVLGAGESVRMRCMVCGREVDVPRGKIEKSIRHLFKAENLSTDSSGS